MDAATRCSGVWIHTRPDLITSYTPFPPCSLPPLLSPPLLTPYGPLYSHNSRPPYTLHSPLPAACCPLHPISLLPYSPLLSPSLLSNPYPPHSPLPTLVSPTHTPSLLYCLLSYSTISMYYSLPLSLSLPYSPLSTLHTQDSTPNSHSLPLLLTPQSTLEIELGNFLRLPNYDKE